ncbi:hypothetical protein [Halomicronema sp. CCY15110]|uniref:hypothetical protein n=1 Tax=Halomicronema sp. CCY15110 TaxID=2767773 RepID=UPI00194EF479|nr:hypothetical protein [Halomicronema sp. CCY15110]
MDEIIAEIKRVYFEEFSGFLAPPVIIISVLYVLCIVVWDPELGVWKVLLSYNVFSLLDIAETPIKNVLIRDIVISLIGAFLTDQFYSFIKSRWFNLISKGIGLEERINFHIKKADQVKSDNEAVNLFLVKGLQKRIEEKEKHISRNHTLGRFFMACLWVSFVSFVYVFLISVYRGSLIICYFDLFFCFISLVAILYVQEKSTKFFLRKLMPLVIMERALLGKDYEAG